MTVDEAAWILIEKYPEKAEQIRRLAERIQDPAFRAKFAALITEEDLAVYERVHRDAIRDAPEPELRRDAAASLVDFVSRKQNVTWQ